MSVVVCEGLFERGGGDAIGVGLVALHLVEEIEGVIGGGVIVEFAFVVVGER